MAANKAKGSAPERSPVVILFAEMRGFTRTSEILQPDVVFARPSEFFALVQRTIERHDGNLRNLSNDTLMASFTDAGNAERAVLAAQEIQRDFPEFEESWERDYGIRGGHCDRGRHWGGR